MRCETMRGPSVPSKCCCDEPLPPSSAACALGEQLGGQHMHRFSVGCQSDAEITHQHTSSRVAPIRVSHRIQFRMTCFSIVFLLCIGLFLLHIHCQSAPIVFTYGTTLQQHMSLIYKFCCSFASVTSNVPQYTKYFYRIPISDSQRHARVVDVSSITSKIKQLELEIQNIQPNVDAAPHPSSSSHSRSSPLVFPSPRSPSDPLPVLLSPDHFYVVPELDLSSHNLTLYQSLPTPFTQHASQPSDNDTVQILYDPPFESGTPIQTQRVPRWPLGYEPYPITASAQVYQMLYDLDRIFSKYGYMLWMQGSLLLGAVRHGGLIPWRTEVELTAYHPERENEVTFDLVRELVERRWVLYNSFPVIRISSHYGVDYEPSHKWPFVTVFIEKPLNNTWYSYQGAATRRDGCNVKLQHVDPTKQQPLKRYDFGHIQLNGPPDPYGYLHECYGGIWSKVRWIETEQKEMLYGYDEELNEETKRYANGSQYVEHW